MNKTDCISLLLILCSPLNIFFCSLPFNSGIKSKVSILWVRHVRFKNYILHQINLFPITKATDSNFVQVAIPRFDGHYDYWSMLMENFLQSKEYWPIIESRIQEPEEGASLTKPQKVDLEARRLKDLKAKNYLF